MSIMYKPVLQSNAKGETEATKPEAPTAQREYQKAREHFSAFFAGKTAEELKTQSKRLAYAQAAIGDLRRPCSWLKKQRSVYFWTLAQSVELIEAQRRLQEKQRQEKQAAQQLRF